MNKGAVIVYFIYLTVWSWLDKDFSFALARPSCTWGGGGGGGGGGEGLYNLRLEYTINEEQDTYCFHQTLGGGSWRDDSAGELKSMVKG